MQRKVLEAINGQYGSINNADGQFTDLLLSQVVRQVGNHDFGLAWDTIFRWATLLWWARSLGFLWCFGIGFVGLFGQWKGLGSFSSFTCLQKV